ncbi:hypothetical protein ABW19_dt0208404 [Dactylella cylindrospora]|nr:hypothetical protein ABW19_dt0208404 [Dactylella cylindrospora]
MSELLQIKQPKRGRRGLSGNRRNVVHSYTFFLSFQYIATLRNACVIYRHNLLILPTHPIAQNTLYPKSKMKLRSKCIMHECCVFVHAVYRLPMGKHVLSYTFGSKR